MVSLTFRQIVKALISPQSEGCWLVYNGRIPISVKGKPVVPGDRIELGKKESFIRVTGFPQASLTNLLENWDREVNGKIFPPAPRYDFFMNVASLLGAIRDNGCPLLDPKTQEPIVFDDFEIDGEQYPGWVRLYAHYAKELGDSSYYLAPVLESQQKNLPHDEKLDLADIMADLTNSLPLELRLKVDGFPKIEGTQQAIATLGVLVIRRMQSLGTDSISEFADRVAIMAEYKDASEIERYLTDLLAKKRLPNNAGDIRVMLSLLAISLRDFDDRSFEGDVIRLIEVCGFDR